MLLKLSMLKRGKDGYPNGLVEEIYVQTESIEMIRGYDDLSSNCLNEAIFKELKIAKKVTDDSKPTDITFVSGNSIAVAEMASYIADQANKPMFNTWPT